MDEMYLIIRNQLPRQLLITIQLSPHLISSSFLPLFLRLRPLHKHIKGTIGTRLDLLSILLQSFGIISKLGFFLFAVDVLCFASYSS